MANWIIAFALLAIGIFFLIQGVVMPLAKNKKCTYGVSGSIVNKKEKGFSADDGTSYSYTKMKVRYVYQGKSYTTTLSVGMNSHKSCVPLRINPARPKMCVLDSRKASIALVVASSILFLGFATLSAFWVIAVIYSLI